MVGVVMGVDATVQCCFNSPALCHPKDMPLDGGLLATQMAKREMRKLAKSESMCAASVMMARLWE